MASYAFNTTVQVRGRFYNSGTEPSDPPGVAVVFYRPSGIKTTVLITDPNTAIRRVSEGNYTAVVRAIESGRWSYQWYATAPDDDGSQPADEGYFDVRASAFD
jgi:hypothetical protein